MNLFKKIFLLLFIFLSLILNATEIKKLKLQLQWKHQFEFAGFYAAKEKGFYKDIGVDLDFIEYKADDNIVSNVLNKKANFGVTYSSLIAEYINGKPVIFLANYLKQSPLVLVTQKKIKTLSDLKNKKVMGVSNNIDTIILKLMLQKAGVSLSNIDFIGTSFDTKKFINKEIDAMAVFTTNEIYKLDELGIKYNIFNPSLYGYENYDVNLFTSKEFLKNNTTLVKEFKEASNKGWKYALENKEEIVELILKKYNTQNKTKKELLFEAEQIEQLMLTKTYPIGQIDVARVEFLSKNFMQAELVSSMKDVDFKDFIFQSDDITLSNEEREFLNNNPVIKVYMDYSYPPYSFIKNDKLNGFSVEYADLLSKLLGVKFEYTKTMTWNSALENLKNKNIDMIGQMVNTKIRREFAIFSQDYYDYFTGIIVRKENSHLTSLSLLNNKTVGVVKGYLEEEILRKHYPNIKIKTYKDNHQVINALLNKEFDASIGIYEVIEYTINNMDLRNKLLSIPMRIEPVFRITKEAFGIRKDWTLLQSALNKTINLTKIQRDELEKKWLSKERHKEIIPFSKEEKEYLSTKKFISMCVDPNFLPYESIDTKSKYIGIGADIMNLVSESIDKPIILIPSKTWKESLENIKNNKCDILPMATKTRSREAYMNFTKPYIIDSLAVATKTEQFFIKDSKALSNHNIGVINGYSTVELLKKSNPNINIVKVESAEEGLRKVQEGELFGYVDALSAIAYAIQKYGFVDLKVAGRLEFDQQLSLASKKEEALLNTIMQKTLNNIGDEKIRTIIGKWIAIQIEQSIDYKKIILITLFFVIVLSLVMHRNRTINKLNKKLDEKNKQLEELSIRDNLTKLFNRNKLDEVLSLEVNRANRYKTSFGIIMIDIDYFKKVNDVYGHQMGDIVLKEVANIIKSNSRKTDTVGRWGGEEFLVVCADTNLEGINQLANNIKKEIASYSFSINEQKTARLGIAVYKKNEDIYSLIKRADDALYKAKDNGRNRIEIL